MYSNSSRSPCDLVTFSVVAAAAAVAPLAACHAVAAHTPSIAPSNYGNLTSFLVASCHGTQLATEIGTYI